MVAEHADVWTIPGGDIDDAVARSALLDPFCAEIARDPASISWCEESNIVTPQRIMRSCLSFAHSHVASKTSWPKLLTVGLLA